MSGFLGGLFGSGQKTDRKEELSGFTGLNNVLNFALPTAQKLGTGASNYFSQLLSGNRSALASATAPQTNATLATADAQKRQQAESGTARGGGAAVPNATRSTAVMSAINNELFKTRTAAAGTGLSAATNLASTAGQTSADLADIASKSRQESSAINSQAFNDVGTLISAAFG